jgi:hypothetical protein
LLKKSPQKVSIPTFLPRFFILDLSNNCILENRHGTSQAYTTNSDGEKISPNLIENINIIKKYIMKVLNPLIFKKSL